jgi:hypothetical protein
MAATQFMSREADPTATAIQTAGDSVRDTIQKEQALQLTARYYKTMQQNADTEQEKAHYENGASLATELANIKKNFGNNENAAAFAIKQYLEAVHGGHDAGLNKGMQMLGEVSNRFNQTYQTLQGSQGQQPQGQPDYQQMGRLLQNGPGEVTAGQQAGAEALKNYTDANLAPVLAQIQLQNAQNQSRRNSIDAFNAYGGTRDWLDKIRGGNMTQEQQNLMPEIGGTTQSAPYSAPTNQRDQFLQSQGVSQPNQVPQSPQEMVYQGKTYVRGPSGKNWYRKIETKQ